MLSPVSSIYRECLIQCSVNVSSLRNSISKLHSPGGNVLGGIWWPARSQCSRMWALSGILSGCFWFSSLGAVVLNQKWIFPWGCLVTSEGMLLNTSSTRKQPPKIDLSCPKGLVKQVRKPVLDQPFSNLTWFTNVCESTRILLQKQHLSDSPRVAQSFCILDKLSLVIYVQVPVRVPLFG